MAITNATYTDEEGVKVTITQPAARNVIQVDSAETTTFRIKDDIENDTLIEVDTSTADVTLEVEEVAKGAELDVVNVGNTSVGIGDISVVGVDDVVVEFAGTANSINNENGAIAHIFHTLNGEVYVDGNVHQT